VICYTIMFGRIRPRSRGVSREHADRAPEAGIATVRESAAALLPPRQHPQPRPDTATA